MRRYLIIKFLLSNGNLSDKIYYIPNPSIESGLIVGDTLLVRTYYGYNITKIVGTTNNPLGGVSTSINVIKSYATSKGDRIDEYQVKHDLARLDDAIKRLGVGHILDLIDGNFNLNHLKARDNISCYASEDSEPDFDYYVD